MEYKPIITAVSPVVRIGDVAANSETVVRTINTHADSDFIVFPELFLTGYSCQELFLQDALHHAVNAGIDYILGSFELMNRCCIVIVGAPFRSNSHTFNAAYVLQVDGFNSKLLGIVPKTHLPNYVDFQEKRWFSSGDVLNGETYKIHNGAVVGTELLFRNQSSQTIFGVEICEDLFAPIPPSTNMALKGANIIFNLSASNMTLYKAQYRRNLVQTQSGAQHCCYVYTSAGSGESTSETAFRAHCIIAENGKILRDTYNSAPNHAIAVRSQAFVADLVYERNKNKTFSEQSRAAVVDVSYKFLIMPKSETTYIRYRSISDMPFVPDNTEDLEDVIDTQAYALAERIISIPNCNAIVLGVSGGLDSTWAAIIAHRVKHHYKPELRLIGVTMPGLGTSDGTKGDAHTLMKCLRFEAHEFSIVNEVRAHLKTIGHPVESYDVVVENEQARARTKMLFNLGNKFNALVLGTGDMTELAYGWMTYSGDSESHYHINAGTPKTLIKALVDHTANTCCSIHDVELKGVLKRISSRVISPELKPAEAGELQSSEKALGGPFITLDFIMDMVLCKGKEPEEIFRRYRATQLVSVVSDAKSFLKALKIFYQKFFCNQFKRNSAPDGLKIGSLSLSPRSDWRMASEAQAKLWIDAVDEIYKKHFTD